MPSPFPGMDPYLENPELWPDVHHELISQVREALNLAIRPKYIARIESRVYLSNDDDPGRRVIIPDVRVETDDKHRRHSLAPFGATSSTAVLEVAEPLEVTIVFEEEITESQIQIIERDSREVVTVIEILSPTNKIEGSSGRESYLKKRREVLHSPTQWVEIDLLRDGLPFVARELYPACDYTVHVSRQQKRPRAKLWPILLRQMLPVIPVPLRGEDPDVPLDLSAILHKAYDIAGYDFSIDYKAAPVPPFKSEAAAWADELLKEKGLR